METIVQYKKWSEKFAPLQVQKTAETNRSTENLKVARMLNVLTKAKPSQNIRDLYWYKCGYSPCVIIQKDSILQDGIHEHQPYFPAFEQLVRDLQAQRGDASYLVAGRVQSDDCLLVPGDIIAVNPGTDNGIPSGDKWWLLQVNKPHPLTKNRPGCHVCGFWLDERLLSQYHQG